MTNIKQFRSPSLFSVAMVAGVTAFSPIPVPAASATESNFSINVSPNHNNHDSNSFSKVKSAFQVMTGRQPNDPREEEAMTVLREKGATFARLADLYEYRFQLAHELDLDPVAIEVFAHAEKVLDMLPIDVDRIRIGLSDVGGLELRLRTQQGLYVASLNKDITQLEFHKGKLHEIIESGDLTDQRIGSFFGEIE